MTNPAPKTYHKCACGFIFASPYEKGVEPCPCGLPMREITAKYFERIAKKLRDRIQKPVENQ